MPVCLEVGKRSEARLMWWNLMHSSLEGCGVTFASLHHFSDMYFDHDFLHHCWVFRNSIWFGLNLHVEIWCRGRVDDWECFFEDDGWCLLPKSNQTYLISKSFGEPFGVLVFLAPVLPLFWSWSIIWPQRALLLKVKTFHFVIKWNICSGSVNVSAVRTYEKHQYLWFMSGGTFSSSVTEILSHLIGTNDGKVFRLNAVKLQLMVYFIAFSNDLTRVTKITLQIRPWSCVHLVKYFLPGVE